MDLVDNLYDPIQEEHWDIIDLTSSYSIMTNSRLVSLKCQHDDDILKTELFISGPMITVRGLGVVT